MKTIAITMIVAALLLLLIRGGMQRVDAEFDPPLSELAAGARVDWQLAGSFGEPAVLLDPDEQNAWLKRFQDGGFLEIGGLSATNDEVWVTDKGISRIQIFDGDGQFQYSKGMGMPIREIVPTDMEFFLEDRLVTKEIPRFNDLLGPLFYNKYRGIFQAVDVVVTPDGWFMLDMLRTGDRPADFRRGSLLWFDNDETMFRFDMKGITWPEYMGAEGLNVAFSEPEGNALFWCQRPADSSGQPDIRTVNNTTNYSRILTVRENFFGHLRYNSMLAEAQNVSGEAGQYSVIGGMDFGFDKLVICDSGGTRLQVYNATDYDKSRRHSLARVVQSVRKDGALRFATPLDIAIDDNDAQMYVLDSYRREVAILDSHFNRIGSFGLGDLNSPHAIAISPDGNDIYVSDDRDQCVYHYACADQR